MNRAIVGLAGRIFVRRALGFAPLAGHGLETPTRADSPDVLLARVCVYVADEVAEDLARHLGVVTGNPDFEIRSMILGNLGHWLAVCAELGHDLGDEEVVTQEARRLSEHILRRNWFKVMELAGDLDQAGDLMAESMWAA